MLWSNFIRNTNPDNVQKYLDVLKALYGLLCIVFMLLMCNMICGSSRAVTTKGLKCDVCGNGKDVYHFSPEFDAVYGDTCAIAAPDVEHTYTYKENSASVKMEVDFGAGRIAYLERWRNERWNMEPNETWKEHFVRKGH